jgi:ribose transport system substrate-binding protein
LKDDALQSRYFVETAAKVLDILETFNSEQESLSITEIARRTGLTYSSAFRLLYTLEKRGYVMRRSGRKRYMLSPARRRFRIGFASLRSSRFHREVSAAMETAARNFGFNLITRVNEEFNLSKALLNADQLLAEKIDLLVEYQYNETAGELIAAKCHQAGIPAISINFAQPGAYYFGGNNYQTGVLAGHFLAGFAHEQWKGQSDACLVLPAKGLSSTQEARLAGLRDSLSEGLRSLDRKRILVAPAALTVHEGRRLTERLLQDVGGKTRHILVAALTDHLGLGAEKAIREAGLEKHAVIAGQGGGRDARARIAAGGSFKASVAFFSEAYGESVLSLAIKILKGEKVPLMSYTNHIVLTAENLRDYYATG